MPRKRNRSNPPPADTSAKRASRNSNSAQSVSSQVTPRRSTRSKANEVTEEKHAPTKSTRAGRASMKTKETMTEDNSTKATGSRRRGCKANEADQLPTKKQKLNTKHKRSKTKEKEECKEAKVKEEVNKVPVEDLIPLIKKAAENGDAALLSDSLKDVSGLKAENIQESFFTAVDQRYYQCVQAFIQAKFKFQLNELRNSRGELALFVAVDNDDNELTEALCKKKMNNTKGVRRYGGQTPLHEAARKGNLVMVEALLNCGFDPNSGYHYGRYPLHTAIKNKHEEVAKKILAAGAKPGLPQGEEKETPLILAIEHRMKELAATLLKRKIEIEHKDWFSETALYKAVLVDDVDTARLLIDRGAYPDWKGLTPDMDAPHREGYGDKPLFSAIEENSVEMVRLLLDTKKVTVNYLCDFYRNMDQAVTQKNVEITQMLIEAGADPNLTNKNGMTALHHFADSWIGETDKEILEILLKHIKDISAVDNWKGYSPLMYATNRNNVTVAKMLIQANCDIDVKVTSDHEYSMLTLGNGTAPYKDPCRAIEIAINGKFRSIIVMLIEAGCDKKGLQPCLDIKEENDFVSWLLERLENVLSLKCLCRSVIRKAMGTRVLNLKDRTFAPALNDFILMKEFDHLPLEKK